MTTHIEESVDFVHVKRFSERIAHRLEIYADTFSSLRFLVDERQYMTKSTPSKRANRCAPSMHTFTSNFKCYIIVNCHGVYGKSLQEHRDEFTNRFNRRFREGLLPNQLLLTAIDRDHIENSTLT